MNKIEETIMNQLEENYLNEKNTNLKKKTMVTSKCFRFFF